MCFDVIVMPLYVFGWEEGGALYAGGLRVTMCRSVVSGHLRFLGYATVQVSQPVGAEWQHAVTPIR